ncbi:MAG TPA: amino acid racemase [Pyrinomonadaceae bacterium]|nr:amino acid racemase [Pyrinomonadaceae bacterium]
MKTAGIIGGLGPESTIDYYRLIIAAYRERTQEDSYPSLIINSVSLSKVRDFITENRLPEVTLYLSAEVNRLAAAGADFGALSANTPHIVFDDLRRQSTIPLISIVEATCAAAAARGMKRVGLLGTRFTMQGRFYSDVFDRAGITLIAPSAEEQDYIHDKYLSELVNGIFLPETRERLLAIVESMNTQDGIEGLILGGTELPLILRAEQHGEVPFLDTTKIHVEEIVARLVA